MAVNKGSNWAEAQGWAKKGKFGKAKKSMEAGGGVWSKDIHKNLKYGTELPDDTPDTGTPDTPANGSSDIDKFLEQLKADRASQQLAADKAAQDAYNQGQQRIADDAQKKKDRMNYWKRPGLASTILSNNTGEGWLSRFRKKKSFLTPLSSMLGGGNE
jgi:hypothetical protein